MNETAAIFPSKLAPFRALGLTMAVMCYLACLALGGLLVAQRATSAWIDSVSNEATILVRPLEGVDIQTELNKAADLAKAAAGIGAVKILEAASAAQYLEPWLGKDVATGLPLPRLISLQLNGKTKPDFAKLETDLLAQVKGASLDSHQRWQNEFASLGRGLILLAATVLGLIALATCALVSYAARSVMEANASVVEVLQMVGAEPAFIARANDKQFLSIGVIAGGIGMVLGLMSLWALGILAPANEAGFSSGGTFLFGRAFVLSTFGLTLLIPITATLLGVWTARVTLIRALAK